MNVLQTLRTQYRVSDLIAWQRDGTLRLNPDFQRRSVWKKGAKSYLIDTILRGLPVPIIFLRDLRSDTKTLKSRRDVVDGQQRIRTILSFVDHSLLTDFDKNRDDFTISSAHNKELGGKYFSDLSNEYQQQILDYQFSVHSFPADTDDKQILQIFARMNATGYKLNAQELRNAEFYGEFKTLAYQLSTEQLDRWRDWRIFNPDQIARMNEVELTSELMMLITHGIMEKSKKRIDDIYKYYDDTFPSALECTRRFRLVFEEMERLLGSRTISELFNTRTMFYALFSTIYGLQFAIPTPLPLSGERPRLSHEKPRQIKATMLEQLKDAALKIKESRASHEVLIAARGATADARQRRIIISYLAGPDDDPCTHLR